MHTGASLQPAGISSTALAGTPIWALAAMISGPWRGHAHGANTADKKYRRCTMTIATSVDIGARIPSDWTAARS